jgi:hypothetical protein
MRHFESYNPKQFMQAVKKQVLQKPFKNYENRYGKIREILIFQTFFQQKYTPK